MPLLLAACGTETTELPTGLGPVALVTELALPAECDAATGTGAFAIGAARAVLANPSYNERKARGCVPVLPRPGVAGAPDPHRRRRRLLAGADRDRLRGLARHRPPYPVNFVTKEIPHGGIQSHYTFEVTWRVGVTQGTPTAPTEVKMLYGKTSGTVEVPKILGSMVFTADAVHPGWTRIDLVRQINTNGHSAEPEKLTELAPGLLRRAADLALASARSRPATASCRRPETKGAPRRARPCSLRLLDEAQFALACLLACGSHFQFTPRLAIQAKPLNWPGNDDALSSVGVLAAGHRVRGCRTRR